MTSLLAPYAYDTETGLKSVLNRDPTPFEILLEERAILNECIINVLCMAVLFLSSQKALRVVITGIGALHMAYLATVPPRVLQGDYSDPTGEATTNAKICVVMTAIYGLRLLFVGLEGIEGTSTQKHKVK